MWRIAELAPEASFLEVVERIDRNVWQVAAIPPELQAIYARSNGLATLRMVRARLDKHAAQFALNAAPRVEQWLPTGAHLNFPAALSAEALDRARAACDCRLAAVGTPPFKVFDDPELAARLDLASIVRQVVAALPRPLPPMVALAILKTRTLLRRTFPLARLGTRIGNRNNQLWHQDSNLQFNDRPMLTLWLPLQSISEGTRPGLDIMDAPAAYFSPVHGDSSFDLPAALAAVFPHSRSTPIAAAAGACIAFNGLTFHQTRTTPAMTEHRDALLIRVLDAATAAHFAPDHGDADVLVL